MRCKNCKKKIDNPNLFRCPHCGKELKKKKKDAADRKNTLLGVGFITVVLGFTLLSFLSFFFPSDIYYVPMMMLAAIMLAVATPFLYGGYMSMPPRAAYAFAAAVTVPYIINWFKVFFSDAGLLDRGGICSIYYISVIISVLICDILLILRICNIIKGGKASALIALIIGAVAAIFTIVFYIAVMPMHAFGIAVSAVQIFTYPYLTFHVLTKDYRGED